MAIDIWLSPWKVTASCTHPAAELRTSLHDSSATLPWCNCCECIVCWATTALPWCLSSDVSDGGDGGGLKGPSHAFYDGWCWCWFKYDFWRPGGNEAKTRWNVWLIYSWLGVQCTMRGELLYERGTGSRGWILQPTERWAWRAQKKRRFHHQRMSIKWSLTQKNEHLNTDGESTNQMGYMSNKTMLKPRNEEQPEEWEA